MKYSEEKFRQFFENSNDAIFIADSQTRRLVDCNKKAEKLVGRSKAEILSMRADNLHPTDRVKETMEGFKKQIEGKAEFVETEVLTKTGKRIYVEVNASTVQISGKKYLLGIFRNITDRKQAEEEIKKSEEKYRSLIINIPDVTWTTDFKGNTVFISPNIKRIYGYTQQEIYEKGDKVWFKRIHLDDVEKVKDVYKKLFESDKQFDVEYRIKKKDGKWIWLNDKSITTYKKDGILYADGIFSDITERKKAEEELKERENRYRTLVENIPQKVFLKDKNSVYVSCNDNYAKDLKIKPEEIVGKTDFEFYPKKLAKKYRADDNRVMESGKTEDIEERYVQDEQESWVHTIKTPVKDEKGNVVGLLGIFWNITEQKKSQEELKASEARYRSFIEATKQLGWTTDAKGLIIEDIPTWRAYTGQSFEKIKNWGWIKAIHPDDAKRTAEVWKKAVKTKSIYETEYRIRGKDGKYKWFLARGIPVLKEDGSIREWVGTCIDISERIKIEEEIKSAQKKWNSLMQNTNDIIMIVDDKDIIQYINNTIPPYTSEETIGKTLYEYVPREQHDIMRNSLRKVFKTGKLDSYEISSNIPKIGVMWFSTKVVPIKHDGRGVSAILISTDITKRKKTEEELKKSKDNLQSKIEELERFNRLAVGRELKMIELKKKIKELESEKDKSVKKYMVKQ